MTYWYLDTSAALKLLVAEDESDAFADFVQDVQPQLISSLLLETELRRTAQRKPALAQESVTAVLRGVDLLDFTPNSFREAGLLPGSTLRSLDALHLACASAAGIDQLLTYDTRMGAAARSLGFVVLAPG